MKVTVLVENSVCKTATKGIKAEHGLCLFIEAKGKKILFDVGQSDLFIHNAEKMGIDLSQVDYLIISHGHFDHGGGLYHFLRINNNATIFMHRLASQRYYTKLLGIIPYYIGLNQKIISHYSDRIRFIESDFEIEDGINILEKISEGFPQPSANKSLFEKQGKLLVLDKFKHELILLITDINGLVVFTACSHSGIINMIKRVRQKEEKQNIKAIFGGFHLHNPVNNKNEKKEYIDLLTSSLEKIETIFYTGHCTGERNYRTIKRRLENKIKTLNTGEIIED